MEENITISIDEYNVLRDIKARAQAAFIVLSKAPYHTETGKYIDIAKMILTGEVEE